MLITVRDTDKEEIVDTAKRYYDLGFKLYATKGTAGIIRNAEIPVETVSKIHESENNLLTLIESGKVDYVISTSSKGRIPSRDSVIIRRKAVERSIPCLTSIDTANALAESIKSRYTVYSTELVNINDMRKDKLTLKFTKMQGTGNDYIYFDCFDQKIDNPEGLSLRLSDRHYGIGADGVVLIERSKIADARMRIFNLDGSEGKMCGNAVRCVGKYLYDNGIVSKNEVTVETLSGVKSVKLNRSSGKVISACVDMGKAELSPTLIPIRLGGDRIVNESVDIGGTQYSVTCVSMGNPHCVVFCDKLAELDVQGIGQQFENSELFPERVNTEFVKVINSRTLKMRVWERGNGETWSCGTGACAAAVAAVLNGYCRKNEDITVKLKGGDLVIRYTDEAVYMTGNAQVLFSGEVEI